MTVTSRGAPREKTPGGFCSPNTVYPPSPQHTLQESNIALAISKLSPHIGAGGGVQVSLKKQRVILERAQGGWEGLPLGISAHSDVISAFFFARHPDFASSYLEHRSLCVGYLNI